MTPSSEVSRFKRTISFLSELGEHQKYRLQDSGKGLTPEMELLRNWQSRRLQTTYADFLASKRYAPACRFFLENIYASRDFSQRDHDIEYLYGVMATFLPEFLLTLVRNAVEINNLTNELDHSLLRALIEDLDVKTEITSELYAEGYRICDNYEERKRQIDLIIKIGNEVELSTKVPLVSTALRLARGAARRYGWEDLHDFLESGFNSFKQMHGAGKFLDAIQEREMRILDRIFEGFADPFEM